jgi:signal transduction histidine kinase
LQAIAELTKGAQSEMRAFISQPGSAGVEDGLVADLRSFASSLDTQRGLTIDVQGPEAFGLPRRAEIQLIRICREALTNVVKHASASMVWVRVEARSGRVLVEIRDDGRGFDPAIVHPNHFGLESMRSRAKELGGLLTISSVPGQGTVVRAEAPVERKEPPNAS